MAALLTGAPARADTVSLDTLDLTVATQGWGKPSVDKSVGGNPLTINGTTFDHGFGTHAVGTLAVVLDGHASRFTAKVGLDDETENKGSVVFRLADELGRGLLETPIMLPKADAQPVDVDITGVGTLYLLTDDSNDGNGWDHSDWVDAVFTYSGVTLHTVKADHPTILMQFAPNGWVKVDDSDPNVMYTGDWGSGTGSPCYHRTEHHPNGAKLGFTADFHFVGTQARFYAFKRSDLGRAEIYLDGSFRSSVDMHSFDPLYDQVLFESEALPYGEHWLTVRTTGSSIVVDAFAYRSPAAVPPGGVHDPGAASAADEGSSGCRVAACGASASRWPMLTIAALLLGLAARRRGARRCRTRREEEGSMKAFIDDPRRGYDRCLRRTAAMLMALLAVLACGSGKEQGSDNNSSVAGNGASNPLLQTGPGAACAPHTCIDLKTTCGVADDGCGHILLCGVCATDQVCDPTTKQCIAQKDLCGGDTSCNTVLDACGNTFECGSCAVGYKCETTMNMCTECAPIACDGRCGTFPNGCGGVVECAGCESGQVCDAVDFKCGPCVARTCDDYPQFCGLLSDGCGQLLNCPCPVPGPVPACVTLGADCGKINDPCIVNKTYDCGECVDGKTCINHTCSGCTPRTCKDVGANCGEIDDGCGGKAKCGDCSTAGETCGGGGTSNVCGVCTPKTCAELKKNCGDVSDGCGAKLHCGDCTTAGETCGGSGTANVCGICTPKTCEGMKKNCGDVSDGCGTSLHCGDCTVDQVCGANGAANVCGTCKTCGSAGDAGTYCGKMDDGCGTKLDCGDCTTAGETCGGGGTANICAVCVPKSCQGLGKACGQIDDGCGNKVTCAGCLPGQVCLPSGTCCQPQSCAGKCGTVMSDGCGSTVSCPPC